MGVMADLEPWIAAVCAELGLDPDVDAAVVLDLARDVAHGVARPAAPLTTFLVGRAVGAGVPLAEAAAKVTALAADWPAADQTL
jgi:hypothetical protein